MSLSILPRAFEAARPLRSHDPVTFLSACRRASKAYSSITRQIPLSRTPPQQSTARSFTSSRPALATVVRQNPRKDDEGNEMNIIISERAAKRLRQIVSTPPQKNTLVSKPGVAPDSHLRVTVTSGGCHGFQYLMSLEAASKIDPEEDTIFEFEDDGEDARAEVVLDQPSLELLKGSTVDFTTELIGSQFKIVGNPRATSSCGCGTSFDIE